jgi:delta-1-pyrroline-5-carboxylate synthetase
MSARTGGRQLLALTPEERAGAINTLADLLVSKQGALLEANSADIAEANKRNTAQPLIDRLSLSPSKLKSLSSGIRGTNIFQPHNYFTFLF